MRAVALLLGAVAVSALLWGCASQRVHCNTRLRPINVAVLPPAAVGTRQWVPQ